jgi:pimeloyl-ACP methyl ester carboxylesterase
VAHNPAWSSAEQRAWLEAKREVDLAMVAIGNGRVSSPWPGLCARIATPTLGVTGDPGRGVLVGEQTRATLTAIDNPAITVVEIPGADHYVRQSAPGGFHAVVDPWIAAHL